MARVEGLGALDVVGRIAEELVGACSPEKDDTRGSTRKSEESLLRRLVLSCRDPVGCCVDFFERRDPDSLRSSRSIDIDCAGS